MKQIGAKDILTSLILSGALVALVWAFYSGGWDADLSAVYFAALSYGQQDYDLIYRAQDQFFGASASLEWEAMARGFGFEGQPVLPYIYAPIWAAIVAPVAVHVPPMVFFDAVLVAHAVLCAASVFLAWRIVRPTALPLGLWFIISFAIIVMTGPFGMAFWLNQPQILVTFLILLAFERYRAGAVVAAGVALGFAAAVKITPAVFALVFLMDRDWKAFGTAIATGCAVLLVSVVVAGIDLHLAFLDQLRLAGGHMILTPINFSLDGLLALVTSPHDIQAELATDPGGYTVFAAVGWTGIVSKLCLVGFVFLIWAGTRGADRDAAMFGRLLALWAAVILFGPLGWSHYLIGPLLLLPGVIDRLPMRVSVVVVGLVVLSLSHPVLGLLMNVPVHRGVFMVLGALGLSGMAVMGIVAARRGPSQGLSSGNDRHDIA